MPFSNLPPGCGRLPGEEDDRVTELQEKVLDLLEAADIPTAVNDQIVKLIADAEYAKNCGDEGAHLEMIETELPSTKTSPQGE